MIYQRSGLQDGGWIAFYFRSQNSFSRIGWCGHFQRGFSRSILQTWAFSACWVFPGPRNQLRGKRISTGVWINALPALTYLQCRIQGCPFKISVRLGSDLLVALMELSAQNPKTSCDLVGLKWLRLWFLPSSHFLDPKSFKYHSSFLVFTWSQIMNRCKRLFKITS